MPNKMTMIVKFNKLRRLQARKKGAVLSETKPASEISTFRK